MQKLSINPDRIGLDEAYMQMAEVWAKRSKANRLQVGALIVKDRQIISDGYNGMPAGAKDDICEEWVDADSHEGRGISGLTDKVLKRDGIAGPPDKVLKTKAHVLHAESNALLKIAENGGVGAQGATLYTTYSPCPECAKLIKQAKIARVVYRNAYRLPDGINMLRDLGVTVEQIK